MEKVVILGAGGTGLATGLFLSEKDCPVRIFDAAKVYGGLAGSEEVDGMYFDYGPHIYHTHDMQMRDFWKARFGELLEEKEFFSKNYYKGQLFDYPLSYESINRFPAELRHKVLMELQNRKPEHFKRATNFKECLIALVGPTLETMFFDGYSEKLWGVPTTQMSASWAPKRIEIRKEHKSFWYNQYSAAPIYGCGKIMEKMAGEIKARGGSIYLEHGAVSMRTEKHKIREIRFRNGKAIDTTDLIVISTIPITTLADLLNIKNALEFTEYMLVYLVFNAGEIFTADFQTVYFSDPNFFFHRATEQKKYSAYGYPADKTLLCFEISIKGKHQIEALSEQELIQQVLDQFCCTGMADKKKFVKGFTRRFNHVNPIMKHGFEKDLAAVSAEINAFGNLHYVGCGAEFKYGDLQVMFAKARDLVDLLTSTHSGLNKNIKSVKEFAFNEVVDIYGFKVGKNHPPLIIAEVGLNHNGDMNIARELINCAKKCGSDIVKLQTYSENGRVSATAKGAKYADKTLDMEETSYEMFKRLQLTDEDHLELFRYASQLGIPITSTPFDEISVDLLYSLGVKAFKISSFDLVNIPFLRYTAAKGLPIILSTGMASLGMIEEALDAIAAEENKNVVLLHCVSTYPSSFHDVNLRAMDTIKKAFNTPVGFSDHSIGTLIPLMAMTMGAHAIEKHFTLDHLMEGPDHIHSMDPGELQSLSDNREIIMTALGNGTKRPAASEYFQINMQRKSLFASRLIKAGEILALDNICIKGPGHGLMPKYLSIILGKRATRDIEPDSPVTWDDILSD